MTPPKLISFLGTFLLLNFPIFGITPEEFTAGISKESLAGPNVSNQYFEYKVPSGFSLIPHTVALRSGSVQAQYINYSESKILTIDIQSQHPKSEYSGSDILLERIGRVTGDIDISTLSIVNYTSSQGYIGKEFGYLEFGQPKNEIFLMPEPNYQIYNDKVLGENVIFVRYFGNFDIEEVKRHSDSFKLKNSNSQEETKQNPKDLFAGTKLLPNWTNSGFGIFWQSNESNWIYHLQLGWIYLVPSSTDSNWIYLPNLEVGEKWMWLKKSSFPYLYHYKQLNSCWTYLDLERNKIKQFVNNQWKDYTKLSLPVNLSKNDTDNSFSANAGSETAINYDNSKTWDENYKEWVKEPGLYGGLSVLEHIKKQKEASETILAIRGGVSNISPLFGLTGFKEFWLSNNQIKDLSPIALHSSLTSLMLSQNNISDISPLSGLSNLVNLFLGENKISEISSLRSLSKLLVLEINDNDISDISPLIDLTNLNTLDLENNDIQEISIIENLRALRFLDLSHNNITNITALSALKSIKRLDLSENNISDLSPLVGLSNLEAVYLGGNNISELDRKTIKDALPNTFFSW